MTRPGPGHATFDSVNPANGEVIASFPVCGERQVSDAAVERATAAAGWWAGLDWKRRRGYLLAWKSYLARYTGRIAQIVHTETGKPLADAQLEIVLAIVHIDWAAKHAERVLRPAAGTQRPGRRSTRPRRWSTSRSAWSG